MPHKAFFNSYILRIYRFKKNDPGGLVGVIEEVGVKGKKSFTNYDELWEILNVPKISKQTFKRGKHEITRYPGKSKAKGDK